MKVKSREDRQFCSLTFSDKMIKYGLDWIGKTWTKLIKHGVIKNGLISKTWSDKTWINKTRSDKTWRDMD